MKTSQTSLAPDASTLDTVNSERSEDWLRPEVLHALQGSSSSNRAYNHEEALDIFLLGIEKDPARFEKMIACYRVTMDHRLEKRRRLEASRSERAQVKGCIPQRVVL